MLFSLLNLWLHLHAQVVAAIEEREVQTRAGHLAVSRSRHTQLGRSTYPWGPHAEVSARKLTFCMSVPLSLSVHFYPCVPTTFSVSGKPVFFFHFE